MKNNNRRGVLLLVVLALLAMFAMVAVAFVVMTKSVRISAERVKTIDAVNDPPEKLENQAFNIVLRGVPCSQSMTTVPTSAIKWQSLLEKIYGFETIGSYTNPAKMSTVTPICSGQLIEFTLPTAPPDPATYAAPTIDPFHCVGCVVTMLSGRAAGLSSRIVGINPQNYNVQLMAFDGGVAPAAGDSYIVNGFPYGGMGFGFASIPGAGVGALSGLSVTETAPANGLLALLPNAPPQAWLPGANGIISGGVNADYTAPDYSDPLLAMAVPYNGSVRVPIPSLQRSDLNVYSGAVDQSGKTLNVAILRQTMFRPNTTDHPQFTGSNPNFNAAWDGISPGGSWDVDNMGTGVPDSVWVDLGMPVRYTSDGRAYKPLFAILCLDLDGRLNINVHGSYAQTQQGYYQAETLPYKAKTSGLNNDVDLPSGGPGMPTSFAGPVGSSNNTSPIPLPRGPGTGVAEVNLLPLFRDPSNPANFFWNDYSALLSGVNNGYMGRYGSPAGAAQPGLNGTGAPLSINNWFPYNGMTGGNYWTNFQTAMDACGSPPDPQTFGVTALDTAGRPVYISMGGQVANGPYDIDPTRNSAHAVDSTNTPDNLFGVAESERILRPFDRDAGTLPQRLAMLTSNNGLASGSVLLPRRAEFTTESENVPVAAAILPPYLRSGLNQGTANAQRSIHPVDLLEAKMRLNGVNPSQATLNTMRTQLLPWEILEGLKMDLNRPFGAGVQSTNTNGSLITGGQKTLPDQPGTTGEQLKLYSNASSTTSAPVAYSADAGAVSNLVNPNVAVNDSLTARQLYARHLYVLMMALADTQAIQNDLQKGSAAPVTGDDVARLVAQWAVNVVAYRDHNGIMIPFPYDPNPFSGNGWGSSAGFDTPQYTVWGCKRPELLITETLAFHDVKTQDLSDEKVDPKKPGGGPGRTDPGLTTDTDPKKHDPSFNSGYRPQGSLFVELYNPWTAMEPRTTDLGPNPPTGANWPNGGVDLTKIATVALKSSPVWRIVIVDPKKNPAPANGDELPDPDSPILANRPIIERAAYFVTTTGMALPGDGQVSYYPSPANFHQVVVPPCGYAVIGSSNGSQNPELNRTYIGFENGKTAGSFGSTRVVTMNPSDVTAASPAVVKNTQDPIPSANPPQVLGIDLPQRLSVSEPAKGYTTYESADPGVGPQTPDPVTGKYPATLDIPVDQQRDLIDQENVWAILNRKGTVPVYRVIYLQRLADPTRPFVADTNGNDPRQWNPYRTVDAMTVDLTTFNGLTSAVDPTASNGAYFFESKQRGEKNYLPLAAPSEVNLWKQEPADKSQVGWVGGGTAPTAPNAYFPQLLNQSLGYLNPPSGASPIIRFGKGSSTSNPPGDPQMPFPWLNWSYRPFNNEYELMLVPALSSSRLLARNTPDPRRYFSYVDNTLRAAASANTLTMYDPPSSAQISGQVPYGHLLNYFESGKSSGAVGFAAQMHRIFAYVGVRSRFANAQLQMRPDVAGAGGSHYFHTPFNWISRYREPGRINLNTVTSADVLEGMMNMGVYLSPLEQSSQLNPILWDKYVRSRRGDGGGTPVTSATPGQAATQQSLANMLQINPKVPSRFMHPYRTPGGAFMSPAEPNRETDVGLLLPDPDQSERPLFAMDDYLMGSGQSNASAGATPDGFSMACIDYNRNPYFRYQMIQKMGSAYSTHSNVFAIWITVGYFEVTRIPTDAGHPDEGGGYGYQLGQELGSDSGDIVRHRSFYIFDRSIPCGFIRGQDVDPDKATLVKRFIE